MILSEEDFLDFSPIELFIEVAMEELEPAAALKREAFGVSSSPLLTVIEEIESLIEDNRISQDVLRSLSPQAGALSGDVIPALSENYVPALAQMAISLSNWALSQYVFTSGFSGIEGILNRTDELIDVAFSSLVSGQDHFSDAMKNALAAELLEDDFEEKAKWLVSELPTIFELAEGSISGLKLPKTWVSEFYNADDVQYVKAVSSLNEYRRAILVLIS